MASNESTDYYTSEQLESIQINQDKWLADLKTVLPCWMAPPSDGVAAEFLPKFPTYHPYACNVCKRGRLQKVKLMLCIGCRMASYCCKEHQTKDWKEGGHREFCKIVCKLKKKKQKKLLENQDALQSSGMIKHGGVVVVEDELSWRLDVIYTQRYLDPNDWGMYFMQARCKLCYKAEADLDQGEELVPCPKCYGVSMCKSCLGDHGSDYEKRSWEQFHPDTDGKTVCDHFLYYLLGTGVYIEKGPICLASKHNCSTLFQPRDWNEYLEKKRYDFAMSRMQIKMTPILHSITENLSFPLTIYHALSLDGVDRRESKKKLIVHCVGASNNELRTLRAFAEIVRMNPALDEMKIDFIGPEISSADQRNRLLLPLQGFLCLAAGEEPLNASIAEVQIWDGLYHDVEHMLEKPDLYVAFNSSFSVGTPSDSLSQTLYSIKNKNIPFLLTGYTFNQVKDDSKYLTECLPEEARMNIIVPPSPNPFRSLRPSPDATKVSDKPFMYMNSCFAVVGGQG